jgi:hypothetical protein
MERIMFVSFSPMHAAFRRLARAIVIASLLAIGFLPAASAQEGPASIKLLQNPSNGGNLAQFLSARTPFEFWLTCLIGILGLTIIASLIVASKNVKNPRFEDIARPVIVITVIISTLILVTVGYSNEQIAPAFGLFGTIVGYMLGRLAQPSPTTSAQQDQNTSTVTGSSEPVTNERGRAP